MTRILLTGKDGLVGWDLRRALMPLREIVATDWEQMDRADRHSIRRMVREVKPDRVVNPGVYTAVDQAESEPKLGMKINGEAPGVMAEDAKRLGALLVHNFADYVFDGRKDAPYTEEDAPNQLSVYGRTKLAGQEAIRASSARHLFLHTSWVCGMRGRNSLLNILRLVHEREELLIVADQFGAPTWHRMIAKVTAAILARIAGGRTAPESFDTCRLTAASASCWHEFASAICEFAGKREAFMLGRVEPIAIAGYPIPTVRPGNWRMCLDNIERAFGLDLPSWEHCLQPCREQ